MGLENIAIATSHLIRFWQEKNITFTTKPIKGIQKNNSLDLPNDFKELYSRVNGMATLYPNEIDDEGFLFYPVEAIVPIEKEIPECRIKNKEKIFVFAEYMHKSWWYACEIRGDDGYTIGIVPDNNTFKPITNSLSEFINLYIENSSVLYNY